MARFEKLRISLARDERVELALPLDEPNNRLSRTEFLVEAFRAERKFLSARGAKFNFYPIEAPNGYLAGFFARERPVALKHADLTPYMAENYEPALFVMSIDKDQIVWMEDNSDVGSPKNVLENYFDYLLRRTDLKEWQAYVRYFESTTEYWDVVRNRKREITKIIFRYVPPNAFNGRKLAQDYHREVQRQAKAAEVEEIFKGPAGTLEPEAEMMQENAEIAEQGAGEREIRGFKNKLLYSSKDGRVTDTVGEDEMPTIQDPIFIRRVINKLFKL